MVKIINTKTIKIPYYNLLSTIYSRKWERTILLK